MKKIIKLSLIPAIALLLSQCLVVDENGNIPAGGSVGSSPSYGQPLTSETGAGAVTIREGGRVLTSFRTAGPNVEQTRWYAEQEQIIVKSRGNHGPATIELFNSRTGTKLGSVMAYQAADGPAWARGMGD